jgi:excisionase family DNA binding protein
MDMHETPSRLLSVAEFGERVGLRKSAIYEHLAAGRIKSVHLGKLRRIPDTEIARIAVEGLPSRS